MAIRHAVSGELLKVLPEDESLSAMFSTAIVKGNQLELIRIVLPAGKSMPEHRVPGEITVQCVKGRMAFSMQGESQVMSAGDMLYLAGDVPHALEALEDSTALLTISLPAPGPAQPLQAGTSAQASDVAWGS